MEVFRTESAAQTAALGRAFALRLSPGDLLCLRGGLGAGKTAFCTGLAAGLGCVDEAASPTYAIVNYYRGPRPMAHFDLYRIQTEDDLEAAGFYDYLDAGAIVAVEWSENMDGWGPKPRFVLTFSQTGENSREITVEEATHAAVCP